jgi:hypothetical protein
MERYGQEFGKLLLEGEEQQSDCRDKCQCAKTVTELAEKVVTGHEQRWTNN